MIKIDMKFLLFLILSVLAVGCQTTPNKAAYTTLSAIVTSVDVAKRAYYDYRDSPATSVSAADDKKVQELYLKYQSAMKVAEKTYQATKVPTTAEIVAVSTEFINFANSLSK